MSYENKKELLAQIEKFSTPNNKTAVFELFVTGAIFAISFSILIYGIQTQQWALFLAFPVAAVMITRLFTIQHDCGHGSYFTSQRVNDIVGSLLGVITLTPYHYWRKNHSVHHAFSGNLERRGTGDVYTMTVQEYRAMPILKRAWYRAYRNPAFLLILAPILLFGVKHRLPLDNPFHSVKSWTSIMLTNVGIGLLVYALIHYCGTAAFYLGYFPVMWLGALLGVVGFYIQHQYEDAYWHKNKDWSYFEAGFYGSSHFEFPRGINWLVNNINLHHIHHMNGHIPSYRLRECLNSIPELRTVPKRTLADVPSCFRMALWDEDTQKMVGFSQI